MELYSLCPNKLSGNHNRFEKDFLKFCKAQGVKVDVESKKGNFLQAIFAKNDVSV